MGVYLMDLIADNKENMHYVLTEYDQAYTVGEWI